MNVPEVWSLCRTLAGSIDHIQWKTDRLFKVGGKMYVCTGLEPDDRFSFKVDHGRFLELTDQPGIAPAPYLARAKWVQINPPECRLSDGDIGSLIRRSHHMVLAGLSLKKQREISAGVVAGQHG